MQQTHPNQMGNPMHQQQQMHQFNHPNMNPNQHMGMQQNMQGGNLNQVGFQNYNGPPINNNMQMH